MREQLSGQLAAHNSIPGFSTEGNLPAADYAAAAAKSLVSIADVIK